MHAAGDAIYKTVADGEASGGAIMIIDEKTQHNHLALLRKE